MGGNFNDNIIMKKLILTIIIFFFSASLSSAGFLGDVFKSIGDGIKQGLEQGLGQDNPQRRQSDLNKADHLYWEAVKLWENARYEEAISRFEQALRIARKYNNNFGERQCLLMIGFSYSSLKQPLKTVNYLEAALQIAVNGEEPKARQHILWVLGGACSEIKDYGKAERYLNQSLELARQNKDAENEYFVSSNLSDVYEKTGDYKNAIRLTEVALNVKKNIKKKKMPSDILQLSKLIGYCNKIGEYDKAKNYLKRMFDATKKEGLKDLSESSYYLNLGFIDYRVGNYLSAISHYEHAIEYARKMNDKVTEGDCLNKLGQVYIALGDYVKGINLLKRSLDYADEKTYLKIQGPSNFFLGAAYLRLGEYDEAIKYYIASKEITENHMSEVSDYKAAIETISLEIGLAHLLNGDVKEAEKLLKNTDSAQLYIFYLKTGQAEKAINMVKEQIGKKRQDNVIDRLSDFNNILLGLAYESMGDKTNAHNYYKRATELIENQLEEISEEQKIHFMNSNEYPPYNRLTPYEGLMRVSPEEEAFYYSESAKARLLLEQIASKFSSVNFNIPKKNNRERTRNSQWYCQAK